jgi:drug/metabolite transporter (DMT)-like permease
VRFLPGKAGSNLKHALLIATVVMSNSVGNLFLAFGMRGMPEFHFESLLGYVLLVVTNPWILVGTALLVLFMIGQLSLFTWADLSYVLPVTASGYIVTAILSRVFLHENVSNTRWAGVVIIALGVMLVAETPPHVETPAAEAGVGEQA